MNLKYWNIKPNTALGFAVQTNRECPYLNSGIHLYLEASFQNICKSLEETKKDFLKYFQKDGSFTREEIKEIVVNFDELTRLMEDK